MKLVVLLAVLGYTYGQLCETACDDPCDFGGSEVSMDLVGASGQVKIVKSDDKFLKLKLGKIEERDEDGKKVDAINNLASIDAEWCQPDDVEDGDPITAVLLAEDGDVEIRATATFQQDGEDSKAVVRSKCCFSGEDLCADPTDRAVTDCTGIEDADCLVDDCSVCIPGLGNDDGQVTVGEDQVVDCEGEEVDIPGNALKWTIDLMNWDCASDQNTINFGWDILSKGGSGGKFNDCDGCASEDCDGDDQPACCSGIDEVTCDFEGGRVSLPTEVVINADGDTGDVVAVEFDGDAKNFGVTVTVPCSDHIEYDPTMEMQDGSAQIYAFSALVFVVIAVGWM